jgi:hypothetical protein
MVPMLVSAALTPVAGSDAPTFTRKRSGRHPTEPK